MFEDSFVIVDLETTGLSPKNGEIIEIGAIKVINNEVVDKMDIFVKPSRPITWFTTNLTGITNEMVDLEAHHNMLSLEYMTIMIIEHTLNLKGCVTTFEVIQELEEAHRNNQICIIILDETEHQEYHSDLSEFISIRQCFGDPFAFIDKYIDGMTLDISFKLLLQLKQEEQYNGSFSPSEVRARDQILSWQMYNSNN